MKAAFMLAGFLTATTAMGCDCVYPQFISCTDAKIEKPPYVKIYGKGTSLIKAYNLRVETSDMDLDYEHLSSLPGMVVGTETKLRGSVSITLRIDDGADGTVDAAYRIHTGIFRARRFAYDELPDLLVAAQKTMNPSLFLQEYLVREFKAVPLDVKAEQNIYDDQVRRAKERVCKEQIAQRSFK